MSPEEGRSPAVPRHLPMAKHGLARGGGAAFSRVSPGGRLVVSVPNEDCVPHRNHVREFTRDGLESELRRFGTPVASFEQPFEWLLARVEKAARDKR